MQLEHATASSGQEEEDAGGSVGECPICLTEAALDRADCGHGFCEACLKRLVETRLSNQVLCPICRQPLSSATRAANVVLGVAALGTLQHGLPAAAPPRWMRRRVFMCVCMTLACVMAPLIFVVVLALNAPEDGAYRRRMHMHMHMDMHVSEHQNRS